MQLKRFISSLLVIVMIVGFTITAEGKEAFISVTEFNFKDGANGWCNVANTSVITGFDEKGMTLIAKGENVSISNDAQTLHQVSGLKVYFDAENVKSILFCGTSGSGVFRQSAAVTTRPDGSYYAEIIFDTLIEEMKKAEIIFNGAQVGQKITVSDIVWLGSAQTYSFDAALKKYEFEKNNGGWSPFVKSVSQTSLENGILTYTVLQAPAKVKTEGLAIGVDKAKDIVVRLKTEESRQVILSYQANRQESCAFEVPPGEYITLAMPVSPDSTGVIAALFVEFPQAKAGETVQLDYVRVTGIAEKKEDETVQPADETDANRFITLDKKYVSGNSVRYYTDPILDLGVQTGQYGEFTKSPVEMAARIVAGEGAYADNYTVVRVFNKYQTLAAQFLAYPSSVRGGVQVAALEMGNKTVIACAPYSKDSNEIRIFSCEGYLLKSFVPEQLAAPYQIVSGRFLGGGEQLSVMSAQGGQLAIYSGEGVLIKTIENPMDGACRLERTSGQNQDLCSVTQNSTGSFMEIDCESGDIITKNFSKELPGLDGIYSSAFGNYLGGIKENDLSNIYVFDADMKSKTMDVGRKENMIWNSELTYKGDGKTYVEGAPFIHRRVEFANKFFMNAFNNLNQLQSDSYESWTADVGQDEIRKMYNEQPLWWEPTFTHRMLKLPVINKLLEEKDAKSDLPKYFSVGKNDDKTAYLEISTSYENFTYAPGIPLVEKTFIWSLRETLRTLSQEFHKNPDNLVGLAPVHEQEINVPNSVGDYNPQMIAGFQKYMMEFYGSLDQINVKCGTNFDSVSDIDPPRGRGRGAWDNYNQAEELFTQWIYYNRTVVSQWIMQAYREALLAGFPPELIHAHSIPEGDAVSGFLNDANTRISPVDVILACGTGYGATRYGLFTQGENNFLIPARTSGHTSIYMGEYSSISKDFDASYQQLLDLINSGVFYMQEMTGTVEPFNYGVSVAAIEKYREENGNKPRTATTGGSNHIIPIQYPQSGKKYNIVQIGTNDEKVGRLKSIEEDGTFEGSVYLTPFHAKVGIRALVEDKDLTLLQGDEFKPDRIENMLYGDQLELRFRAASQNGGKVKVSFYRDGTKLKDAEHIFDVQSESQEFLYTLRNQLTLENVDVLITAVSGDVQISGLSIINEKEQSAKVYYGIKTGVSYRGGVSYDVLDRNYIYRNKNMQKG